MAIIGHIFYMVYISIFYHKLSFSIMLYCLIKINDTFMTLQNGLTYIAREWSHFCEKEYIHPLDIYKCLVFLIWRNSLSITSRKWTYNDAKVDSWSKRKISRKKRNLSFNLKHFFFRPAEATDQILSNWEICTVSPYRVSGTTDLIPTRLCFFQSK